MTSDDIVYQARLHWILFLWPVVFFVLVVYVGIAFEIVRTPSILLAFLTFAWGLGTWTLYHFSSLTIKKKRVIVQTGMLVRKTLDIPIEKIESIDIRQSIVGVMFGYGSLEFTGTGGTREVINFLCKPLTCRRYIEQAMHNPEASQ